MKTRFISIEKQLHAEGFSCIAGIDEVGRGPLAGPVVSAAVILKKNAKIPGLNDSKQLTKAQREAMFPIIMKNVSDYSIAIVSPKTIDKINIANAIRLANKMCIDHLEKTPDIVLIDGRDKQTLDIPHKTIIKGDAKVKCIAAASVLAKVFRDKLMEYYAKEFPSYGFEKHAGYGTREHRTLIGRHGPCEIHRMSYNWNLIIEP
ncbi:MAG: ribonuclease HII [Candidatus Peregrinibacteria bacterium]|nr:ribonuclease HII [Candidatus Peregrinibacteria bacterium]